VGLLAPLAGVLLFGLAVAVGSLLAPETALAELALFRVEQSWHNSPTPPVTVPGGAGMYQAYIQPYLTKTTMGAYIFPAAKATVEAGNPVGGKFTLPQSFIDYSGTFTITPWTGRSGYTTIKPPVYYAGPGVFRPNNTYTGSTATRVVFPTTGGNPAPNYATGSPVTSTTTFNGRYDFSRVGSINVTLRRHVQNLLPPGGEPL
jgi:hypothetical protein